MLSLRTSVGAFFTSTKVIPVYHCTALHSKLYSPSLAQLAVGSRRYIQYHVVNTTCSFISLAPHYSTHFAKLMLPSVFPTPAQGCFSFIILFKSINYKSIKISVGFTIFFFIFLRFNIIHGLPVFLDADFLDFIIRLIFPYMSLIYATVTGVS